MLRRCLLLACTASLLVGSTFAATAQPPAKTYTLHNGWKVTPAGELHEIAQMPIGVALSPDRKQFAFACAGYGAHTLTLISAQTGKIQQVLPVDSAWNGVAWSPDGATLYLSGGGQPKIHVFTKHESGQFAPSTPIAIPGLFHEQKKGLDQSYLSGLVVSPDGSTLYAGNFATDAIYAISLPDGAIKTQRKLDTNAHPYCLRLSPDGTSLYVTQGALASVSVLSLTDLSTLKTIDTDKHPNDMVFAPDGRLFVSCANSDCVDVIDPETALLRERIRMTLTTFRAPAGANPQGLALSPNGKQLYVANSDNNNVAVVDVSVPQRSSVLGFIPTGWYPTSIAASPDGKRLFLGTGKGMGVGPNSPKNFPKEKVRKNTKYVYAPGLFKGYIGVLSTPNPVQLKQYTQQVMANSPYRDSIVDTPASAPAKGTNPIPSRVGDPSPIKHVLYIIKENRTYDQVLGDLKKNGKPYGNGDPDLTLFGEKTTPNIHELARQYVLLDNTFCSGDVSGNGHPWSTAAFGTDIGERAWQLNYSGRAAWPLSDRDLFPPVGRIWDIVEGKGLSWVSYYYTWTTTNTHRNMPVVWEKNLNKLRDYEVADLFINDLKQYERNHNLPRFMIMSLREDHTHGTSAGDFTPTACVASNDYGLGKIVAACSKSPYWKEMAIFVIEDDGQDGPDHVEAHRTEALVISPYTRTGKIDSTFYTTVSLLRTMELILGLPPMSQYDAAATPMYRSFAAKPDLTPYAAIRPKVDVLEKNKETAYGAKESLAMDFSDVDRLTAKQVDRLNRILWHSIKGEKVPYPVTNRRAILSSLGTPTKDDDD